MTKGRDTYVRMRVWMVAVLLFALVGVVKAQSVKFFTADDGLSCTLFNSIYQDTNGNIWIATEDGLNRYDGVKLTTYRNIPGDPHSLAHNYVKAVMEDSDGHLLIGSYGGVQLYDPRTDTFSEAARYNDDHTASNFISKIIQRRNGEIWASGNVVCRIEFRHDRLVVEELSLPIPTRNMGDIVEDDDENIWIAKEGGGVYRLGKDGQVSAYPVSATNPFIAVFYVDTDGRLYGGSPRNGPYVFDKEKDAFLPLTTDQQDFAVKVFYPTPGDGIYIGTDGQGIKVWDKTSRQLMDYAVEENAIDTRNAKIHAICQDHTGNYWMAVYQRGVLMVPRERNGFMYWGNKSATWNIIGNCCVTAIYIDHKGRIYVGTDNDGLYVIKDGRQQAHYVHTGVRSVPSTVITIFEDSAHRLWLGSWGDGASMFDPETGLCTRLDISAEDGVSEVLNVYGFAEDSHNRMWVATMGGGLFYRRTDTGEMVHVEECGEDWIGSIFYSVEDDILYVGSYNGIYYFDLSSADMPMHSLLLETIVYSIYRDPQGKIWAGTSAGLSEWDPRRDALRTYTVEDGLCNNSVYGVEGGDDGNLWLSTGNGLSRFNPETHEFSNFYVGDGIQGNEFTKKASWKDRNGLLWFGGMNGVTFFDPREITTANEKWHVKITDFYLYGKPIDGGRTLSEFHLSHKDNTFTIEFSTVELDSSDRIIYSYSLNNDQWVSLPVGSHQVSFGDLQPGTYHFRLKAKDGLTESDVKEITIYIAQPWWNTWWAWMVYVAIVVGIVYVVYLQVRHRYLARRERERLIRAEQLNEEKLQFFMNVSHDIRTPMSLIISPLKRLLSTDTDRERQKIYHTMDRNAGRILSLVNQLMDIRKIDKGQMHLIFKETDIVPLLWEIYNTFVELAQTKDISFTFRKSEDTLPVWLDTAAFDKIVLNILSNAFKFTPEEGEVEMALHTRELTDEEGQTRRWAEITVTDSGIGIDVTELERIFNRFYQTKNVLNYKGTGIGLHLTRSLVQLHHGVVFAENRDDGRSGSRFVVRLPLGSAHLSYEEREYAEGTDSTVVVPPHDISELMPVKEEKEEEEKTIGPSRTRKRILIVEDDEEIRRYLREELSRDYYVAESMNGKDALETLFKNEVDLVLSDIMMPEMDGLTLCRKMKQNIRLNHIPIVLLTAKTGEEDNIEGLDTGADAYVMKPFNMEVLRHTLKNLIAKREQLRNIYTGSQDANAESLEKIEAKSPNDRLMARIMRSVNAHMSDPDLKVETIAQEVGISRVHLHRKLKEMTNQTTRVFLRNLRMQQAAQLLAEKPMPVAEVAGLVGYDNIRKFSSTFKELYGLSPKDYQKQHSKNGEIK